MIYNLYTVTCIHYITLYIYSITMYRYIILYSIILFIIIYDISIPLFCSCCNTVYELDGSITLHNGRLGRRDRPRWIRLAESFQTLFQSSKTASY